MIVPLIIENKKVMKRLKHSEIGFLKNDLSVQKKIAKNDKLLNNITATIYISQTSLF